MSVRDTRPTHTLTGRLLARMATTLTIHTPARRMVFMVRSGLQAESLSAPDPGTTGAGDMADTMVGRGIGVALAGVAQDGAMDAATLAVTDEAMLVDTRGAVKFMAAQASMAEARSTEVEASMVGLVSTAVAVDTAADIDNRVEHQK
jgi:hypothetical protein